MISKFFIVPIFCIFKETFIITIHKVSQSGMLSVPSESE